MFNVLDFGAKPDGYFNCTEAFKAATLAALGTNGTVYIPSGSYLITEPICFPETAARIAFVGDSANTSLIYTQECGGFNLAFAQSGAQQPFGATIRNLGLHALGKCGEAIRISYGVPDVTNDHNQPSTLIRDVEIVSSVEGAYSAGVDLQGAWNPLLENVFASGDSCGGNWDGMKGDGIVLRGMCVNAHVSNCRLNFWANGLRAASKDNRNTEGLFIANTSMVAVKRGVWITGDPNVVAPRISTLTMVGGLIELRVSGVEGTSAAVWLQHVWTALITGVQVITDSIEKPLTYGVVAEDSVGVVVSCCDMNAVNYGIHTAGVSRAINASSCTFTNCKHQLVFAPGTADSRSYGHVLFNNAPNELDYGILNKIGFVD